MRIERFEDIIAWQKAKEITVQVYKLFKESKDFGFKDQIQRASVSVMNNIAEGFERKGNKEFRQFLFIAKGSCGEVRSMLHIAKELNKITENDFNKLFHLSEEISKILSGLGGIKKINPIIKTDFNNGLKPRPRFRIYYRRLKPTAIETILSSGFSPIQEWDLFILNPPNQNPINFQLYKLYELSTLKTLKTLKTFNFMNFTNFLLILTLFTTLPANSQTIRGTFPGIANQNIKLFGFNGFKSYVIDSIQADENGDFNLSYSKKDYGMGYLSDQDNKTYFVVLGGESIKLNGEVFHLPETIEILEGKENQLFAQYADEHPRREQALSAWGYLEKLYGNDSLFAVQTLPKQAIASEKQRIKTEDSLFLACLPENSYVSYYLPLRKLVSSVSAIAQYRTEEIPAALASFRKTDYTDARLQKSGLLADGIESHFWLIENSGHSLDSVYIEMNTSIDILVENLLPHEHKLNEITEYLFKFLEKRSLFKASEYLALKLLNEQGCTLNNDFAAQLESYRAMKQGNIAPDFDFNKGLIAPGYDAANQPQKLSDIKSNYTAVVFGASWCPQCQHELSQMAGLYKKWKEHNVEVVFVSLDEDEKIFNSFAGVFPFISTCDYQKWESPIVKDYHVFATPTLYLLNNKREILLRPNSVSQLDSWVDWYLVQGNK